MAGPRPTNRQTAYDRRRLVKDFDQRVQDADPVQLLTRASSVAIVVHPTADETELLQRIGSEPSCCESVDAYWRYGGSVYWVEVLGQRYAGRPAGIYYLFDREHRQDVLEVTLPHTLVYSWDLHQAFDSLEALVDSDVVWAARSAFEGVALRLADLPDPGGQRPRAGTGSKA
jgi:hypothetical protein